MIRTTQLQAAHFVLRQNYLAAGQAAEVGHLVNGLIGLPAEPADTPYLAAHARLAQFNPAQLDTALYHQRTLLQSILMRSTSYLVLAEHYPLWYAATARQRNQDANSEYRLWGLDPVEVDQLEKAIMELGDWPATVETIAARLPSPLIRELSQTSRGGRVTTISNVALVLRWLTAKGILGASPTLNKNLSGSASLTGFYDPIVYAPLTRWYPNLNLSALPDEATAQAELVRAYLTAFGPATEADISFWTGFGKSETARAVGALADQTTLTLVEGIPGMLLLLKEQADALQSTLSPTEPVINVLPADDPFTTAHRASRSRYFNDQKLQRFVFSSSGSAQPTIVVNGQIVGTWERSAEHNRLTWQLLTEVSADLLPFIETEIERAGDFLQLIPQPSLPHSA